MKVLFLDVEATGDGTDFNNEILQIGAELWIDGLFVDSIEIDMSPSSTAKIKAHEALADKHRKEGKPSTKAGLISFTYWLEKHIKKRYSDDRFMVVCYSSSFDERNIFNWFVKNKKKLSDYFILPFVCALNLSTFILGNKVSILKDRKLATLCRALDIQVDYSKMHTALYDAMLCRQVYFKLTKKWKK